MAYTITNARIGMQPIATTSTTQNHPLGTIVHASDPTYGEGEFIYLLGVASTAVGNVVTYSSSAWQTTRAAVPTSKPQSVAFAMSANVASQYGWYQIGGVAFGTKLATVSLAAGIAVGIKTVGRISISGTGKEIEGAYMAANSSAKTGVILATLMINRPHIEGRIT